MHWIKYSSFLKKNLLRLMHIFLHTVLKMCLLSSLILSSLSTQLSAAILVLLAAGTHFTTNSHHELLSPENSGSGWKNILLAQN